MLRDPNLPSKDDDMETIMVKNIVHILANNDANLAISALVKVLESLLVGTAPNKGIAIKYVATLSKHLKKELNSKEEKVFGYLYEDAEKQNDPIIVRDKMN